jgi:hypothetical protein
VAFYLTSPQTVPTAFQIVLTASLLILAIHNTVPLSSTVAVLYTAVFTFITFVAPAALIWAQRFKKSVSSFPSSTHRLPRHPVTAIRVLMIVSCFRLLAKFEEHGIRLFQRYTSLMCTPCVRTVVVMPPTSNNCSLVRRRRRECAHLQQVCAYLKST